MLEWLKANYHYDPELGVLARKFDGHTGYTDKRGYRQLRGPRGNIWAHRAAWMLAHGDIPDGLMVDHINQDKSDNRLSNLRLATMQQNKVNESDARPVNRLRIRGVRARGNRFEARLKVNYQEQTLGRFATAAEAQAAYERARCRHFGEFAPGGSS